MEQEEVAARIWNILVDATQQEPALQFSYSQLGEKVGRFHRNLKGPLHMIQDYCLDNELPVITGLVYEKATGMPSTGYFATSPDRHRRNVEEVVRYPWEHEPNPFEYALDGYTKQELVEQVLSAPEDARVVHGQNRGVQQSVFRDALLHAYERRCAFSGAALEGTLEAAHIIPWRSATDTEKTAVWNGLLLNTYYHKLFDLHILRLDESYVVRLDHTVNFQELQDFDQRALDRVIEQRMWLPKLHAHHPSKDLIWLRNEEHRRKSGP